MTQAEARAMEIELIAKHVARSTAGRSSIGRRVASTQATPIAASHNRQSTAPHCPPSGRGGPGVSNHHVVIGPAVKFVMQPIIGLPVYEQSKAAGGRLSDDSEMVSRGGNHGPRRFRHLVSPHTASHCISCTATESIQLSLSRTQFSRKLLLYPDSLGMRKALAKRVELD